MSVLLTYPAAGKDVNQLHDELLRAELEPELVLVDADTISLTFPDGTVEAEVDAVVAAHVPQARYEVATRQAEVGATLAAQRRRALFRSTRTAVQTADNLAALRAATLRLIDAVEELV